MKLSVIICTYNPKSAALQRVLQSLSAQTLPLSEWELMIVDNGSDNDVLALCDLSWHPDHRLVKEEKAGLVHARICGALLAKHDIQVSVDDDTPLFPDCLENIQLIYRQNPGLGIIGGRTVPEFAVPAPAWIKSFYSLLAIRDLGDDPVIEILKDDQTIKSYPQSAAVAVMATRKKCMLEYVEHFKNDSVSHSLGRKGNDLSSGEDNDINLFIYKNGYGLGYFPQLQFIHLIPESRLQPAYLARLQYASSKTWIKVLSKYGINPWPKIPRVTVRLRKIKAWINYRAWSSPENYIRWRGACGTFEALAE
ncbi:MAG: glycosyl transferase family 2 [Mucilaginibacter sp.]|nr:glycosyl transferase family 2 [Mucilaginibacter sp.]